MTTTTKSKEKKVIPENRIPQLVCVAAFVMCCPFEFASAAADDSKQPLDAQLLDDLDSELLNDLKNLPPIPRMKEPEAHESKAGSRGADEKEKKDTKPDQIGAGEDVEFGKSTDPLTRIGQRMRTAKNLIDGRNTSTQTQQLQEEILDDLTALIAKLQSQQMRPSGDQSNNPGSQLRPGAGDGSADGQADQRPERSTDRVGEADTTLTALQRQRELLRRMNWGSLPDRLRDQVRSTRVEQFLPKYARLIEQYYKRLADESQFQP